MTSTTTTTTNNNNNNNTDQYPKTNINPNINIDGDGDDDDEDDEEDEDYQPTIDHDDDEEEDDGGHTTTKPLDDNTTATGPNGLSPSQQSAVDEAFASLFGTERDDDDDDDDDDATVPTRNNSKRKKGRNSNKTNQKSIDSKRAQILGEIFGGSSIASKLMATSSRRCRSIDRCSNDGKGGGRRNGRKRSMEELTSGEEVRRVVKERRMFAGKEIEVDRVVTTVRSSISSSSAVGPQADGDSAAATTTVVKPEGIDSLLSRIDGPQKMNTMTKSDADWEVFKDREGLEEELKKKAEGKEAFLVKKDFLERVDLRKFELEKAGRERERAAAAAAAAAGGR